MRNEHSCKCLATTCNENLLGPQTVAPLHRANDSHDFGTAILGSISTRVLHVPQLDITVPRSYLELITENMFQFSMEERVHI